MKFFVTIFWWSKFCEIFVTIFWWSKFCNISLSTYKWQVFCFFCFFFSFSQFVLAGRCLWILDKIRHRHLSVCSLPPVYQTALSACCQLQIRGGFARHDFCSRDLEARLCEVAQEVGEERGSEVKVSSLSCRLVLASLHLEQREVHGI